MAIVNLTRPHCVNQMGKTHKHLAARHDMCESAFSVRTKQPAVSAYADMKEFLFLKGKTKNFTHNNIALFS